jgi:hypothetical protein
MKCTNTVKLATMKYASDEAQLVVNLTYPSGVNNLIDLLPCPEKSSVSSIYYFLCFFIVDVIQLA